jgi:hypothetical protein
MGRKPESGKPARRPLVDDELADHLLSRAQAYEKHDPAGRGSGNSRNGTTPKTVLTRRSTGPGGPGLSG